MDGAALWLLLQPAAAILLSGAPVLHLTALLRRSAAAQRHIQD